MIKLTDKEFTYMVSYVKNNFGIDLSKKRVLLEGRLGQYLLDQGYADFTAYIKALEADKSGKELTNLLNKVTTNHTYFMRESNHFDFLRDTVLPQMERMVQGRDLRVWCAASSSGEEPYTLAMILNDYFARKVPAWDKGLLATDISLKVLEQAKTGMYPLESIKDVPEKWKRSYFKKVEDDIVQVVPEIRNEVTFRRFNLMDKIVAKKPYHVIFCRNVMIYFDTPTKSDLIDRFYDVMAPGGYFFVGYTETIPKPSRFKYVMPSVYQKA
jgi:chemotaxis protein methyltransferase CheR